MTRRVLALPDKFRDTATAEQVCAAIGRAARAAGWEFTGQPVSDGGEGFLDCFGAPTHLEVVTGPADAPIEAAWLLDGERAVIEMAQASGRVHADIDPVAATTRGTGELIARAIEAGARRVFVGAGGSATTDGGLGAAEVLADYAPLDGSRGYEVAVAADVTTLFADAARSFAAQKGASPAQVELLTERLSQLAIEYRRRFDIDVSRLPGAGAAGGLAGGLAALGATIRPGFAVVADELRLVDQVRRADLVLTGEGRLDRTSLAGKVPASVVTLCRTAGVPSAVVCGVVADEVHLGVPTVSLTESFGAHAAQHDTLACIERAATLLLSQFGRSVT